MAAIKYIKPVGLSILILLGSIIAAQARTSLVSLPARQHVAIRLGDHGTTLVQEKRILSLKKGINKIDFSWQNVMIDTESIILQTLSNPDVINILSVSYPPGEAALVWDIHSPSALEEEVIISYLLANIDGIISYKAVCEMLPASRARRPRSPIHPRGLPRLPPPCEFRTRSLPGASTRQCRGSSPRRFRGCAYRTGAHRAGCRSCTGRRCLRG